MLLALLLCAAPVDVEAMTLEELLAEDTRLELTPTVRAPAVMMGVGLGIAVASFSVFGVATVEKQALARLAPMPRRDLLGPESYATAVQLAAIIHGVLAAGTLIAGVLWYPSLANTAELAALERARVRARITALETSGATYDRVRTAARQLDLIDASMPSYALPGNLMFGGVVSLVAGAVSLGMLGRSDPVAAACVAELVVGSGLVALASWLLYRTSTEREWLRVRRLGLEAQLH